MMKVAGTDLALHRGVIVITFELPVSFGAGGWLWLASFRLHARHPRFGVGAPIMLSMASHLRLIFSKYNLAYMLLKMGV